MDIWKQIETSLSTFENSDADQRALRMLTSELPTVLDGIPPVERERAQALRAEALYQVESPERVAAWVGRPLGAGSALWLGHALFDLERCADGLPYFRRAEDDLPLQDWALAKVREPILCIKIQSEPGAVTTEDLKAFHAK